MVNPALPLVTVLGVDERGIVVAILPLVTVLWEDELTIGFL